MRVVHISRTLWSEFCRNGTVYAFRYLVMEQTMLLERLWWLVCILGAMVMASWMIVISYRNCVEGPVVISYTSGFKALTSIPFPAVTICPLSKTRVEALNLTEIFEMAYVRNSSIELEQMERLHTLAHICPQLHSWYDFSEPFNDTSVDVLLGMALPLDEVIYVCLLRGQLLEPGKYVSRSLTDDGVCYTFNAIAEEELFRLENLHSEYKYSTADIGSSNWTMENGYVWGAGMQSYPFRAYGEGYQNGLLMELTTRLIDDNMFCEGSLSGFKVLVHPPDELPALDGFYYRLPIHAFVALVLSPQVITTSSSLKELSLASRQCYLAGEKYLRFFKVYNQNNCFAECVANRTAQECGCVHFASVRDPQTRICNAYEIDCYATVYDDTYDLQMNTSGEWRDACDCLPACTTLKYDVEISQLPIDYDAYLRALGLDNQGYNDYAPSTLAVLYKGNHILPMVRRELIGISDMFAKFGGLFSLMMGASMMSMLEIVYYCAIRPWRRSSRSRQVQQVLPWRP